MVSLLSVGGSIQVGEGRRISLPYSHHAEMVFFATRASFPLRPCDDVVHSIEGNENTNDYQCCNSLIKPPYIHR